MHTEEKNEQNIRQQEAVHRLHECCTEENLWRCIAEFQNTRMWTASGLPFQYKLKVGRNGRQKRRQQKSGVEFCEAGFSLFV